ncbi:hypothetical protein [Calidifontibacillus oryziterrae]|uniref:hypothetical protein n=1 Tax=Calidifontibacillus oryziterrae TaxID=1191699 RepID=UPI000315B526|nr:hypothetical protein [Calidifontibacillus oryziterrae]
MDTYAQLFTRFYFAQNGSPLFHNPLSPDDQGELVFPMNNDIIQNPFNVKSPNYLSCIYLKKDGKQYGYGKAIINMDIFYNENERINGNFSNSKQISEQDFRQLLKQINEELSRVLKDDNAEPHWYS